METLQLVLVLATASFSYTLASGNVDSYDNICLLPKVVGPCEALIPRYYYNSETEQCEKFTYGGCEGNANNFETLQACQKTCIIYEENVCLLPKVIGPCDGHYPRYYYNPTRTTCQQFIYGGCEGNGNNFLSLEHCKATCQIYASG